MENSKYRLNEWLISRLQECFRGYAKLYLKQDGKIILLNKYQMYVNLFNLQFPSVQTFNINCFLHAPFQDLPNLMTRERQVDKVKVCSEPDFPHLGTDHVVYEHDKPHFLSGGGVTQEPGAMYMCCQALKDAEFLAWGRIKHIYVQNPSSCCSPACSGCSWPSPSLVGMLPNVRACVQGERTAHRHVELH